MSVLRDRTLRFIVRAVGASVLVLALSAQVAMAHAYLESSSPASGVREETAAPEQTLRFDDSLNRQLSKVTLYDVHSNRRSEVSTVALMDPGVPAWCTLRIDVRSGRVLSALLITSGHTEESQFSQFNSARPILAPTHPCA